MSSSWICDCGHFSSWLMVTDPCPFQSRLIPPHRWEPASILQELIWSRQLQHWPGGVPHLQACPPLPRYFRLNRWTGMVAGWLGLGQGWMPQVEVTYMAVQGRARQRLREPGKKLPPILRAEARYWVSFHCGPLFCKMGVRLAWRVCFQISHDDMPHSSDSPEGSLPWDSSPLLKRMLPGKRFDSCLSTLAPVSCSNAFIPPTLCQLLSIFYSATQMSFIVSLWKTTAPFSYRDKWC